MGPITEAVHRMINEREAEGLAKYGRYLDHDSPIDALLELGRELADAPQYYQLHLRRWNRITDLLQKWHQSGHDVPSEVLKLISYNTPAEELEVNPVPRGGNHATEFVKAVECLRQSVMQAAVESVGELEEDERIKALILFFHDNGYNVYCRPFSPPNEFIPYPSEYRANEQIAPTEQQAKFDY